MAEYTVAVLVGAATGLLIWLFLRYRHARRQREHEQKRLRLKIMHRGRRKD